MQKALKKEFPSPHFPPQPSVKPGTEAPRPKRISPATWVIATLSVLGLAIVGAVLLHQRLIAPQTTNSIAPIKRQSVTALGWLEPASNIIKLAPPATLEAARISEIKVKEGDSVARGQVVAVLDLVEKYRAQVRISEAQVSLKQAAVEKTQRDVENSTVARQMALARAQADREQAEAEYERQKALAGRDYATVANLEKRKRDFEVATAQVNESMAALKRIGSSLAEDAANAVQIDIAVAKRELAAAEADLAHSRALLDQTAIRSPIDGHVISILTRPGEKVSQDGVMEVGSTNTMVAIAEVYQSDVELIKTGQRVQLKSEALTRPVTGSVERISLKVKRQTIINNDPATDTDARVIEARIKLDEDSSKLVSGLNRLQVRAFFSLEN